MQKTIRIYFMTSKLITIYGIRRSGNHAIANWIMSHFTSGCYINDANMHLREHCNKLPCHNQQCKNLDLNQNPEIVIVGIENKLNSSINSLYLDKLLSYNKDTQNYEICLIRNCGNLIASHLKAWGHGSYHEEIPNHWKQYIDFYDKHNSVINLLIYDHWLEHNYRNKIAKTIGFKNTDLGIKEISHYGGGSSFGEKTVNEQNLKNRWTSMLNNTRFINIMNNFQYWKDHENIFGQDDIYQYFNK